MRKALEITVKVGCPYKCGFCPQPQLAAAYTSDKKSFSMREFGQVLDKLPHDVEIHFSGFTEPFTHPHVHEMMALVRFKGFHQLHLYTTLMGLRGEQLETLKITAPDHIRIHVPDIKAFVVPDAAWIKAHKKFILAGLSATYMTMGEVPQEIRLHLAIHGIAVEAPDMLSRGGNLGKKIAHSSGIRCSMDRWHSNVLLPNGDVYGCCMDYALTVPLGNLLRDSYEDILTEGEAWRQNMEKRAFGTICSHCEWAQPL